MHQLGEWLDRHGLGAGGNLLFPAMMVAGIISVAVVANLVARLVINVVLGRLVRRTETSWDDIMFERRVFSRLSHFASALTIYHLSPLLLEGWPVLTGVMTKLGVVYMIVAGLIVADALLNAVLEIYEQYDVARRVPLKGLFQVLKLVILFVVGITVLTVLTGERPGVFLGGMGALTAVLMLIFRDPILGFVGGIQLSANKMVQVGDWIDMPRYNADGDVIDVSLTAVKVRNWDKSITSIPTYALVSDSFKNWQAMKDWGGRRIARSIYIDMTSIRFCTDEMLERFSRIQFLEEYIVRMRQELAEYNRSHGIDDSTLVNGRRMTNLGTFRAYLVSYLEHHAEIHQDILILARQLEPTERGVPVQVYAFTKTTAWAEYEEIVSDIFDHILAVVPFFDLRVYQYPTGEDLRTLSRRDLAGGSGAPS